MVQLHMFLGSGNIPKDWGSVASPLEKLSRALLLWLLAILKRYFSTFNLASGLNKNFEIPLLCLHRSERSHMHRFLYLKGCIILQSFFLVQELHVVVQEGSRKSCGRKRSKHSAIRTIIPRLTSQSARYGHSQTFAMEK